MSDTPSKQELIDAYKKADSEGRKHLADTNHTKGLENVIATIKMNACTNIKNYCIQEIGRLEVK